MSEAFSALGGVRWTDGIAEVEEVGPVGMIAVRGDLASAAVRDAVKKATGLGLPEKGEIKTKGESGICWMSPDELLVLCSYVDAAGIVTQMEAAFGDAHALAVNVSDARAVFRLSGPRAREVLAKLAPVDLHPDAFGPGRFRRTRLAQVPGAFWMRDAETFEILCFRSVAQYVFDLLKVAARPGSEVGHF